MSESTRRNFLKSSAMSLVAATAVDEISRADARFEPTRTPGTGSPHPSGEIACRVTNGASRFELKAPLRWEPASGAPTGSAIVLDPNKKFQEILGFGGAFTDAACFVLNQLPTSQRDQLFHELFHPSEMGLSVCRTCIGASDYSTNVYGFDEGEPDPELKRFSIDHDREYILPILREARKANPGLFLFSSAWSPPGWMKSGASMLGGAMRRRYLGVYAEYLSKFLQAYSAEGVPVQAVTVQNEVDTDQDARMPACIWPQEYEIEFVRDHLGPLLEHSGINTKIWILDHNYNLWGRAICELDDSGVRRYSNAVAWHGYVGTAEMMSKVHDAHPDAEMYWTEGGPDITSPDYQTDWAKWGKTFIAALRNWCRAITAWNLALDERGNPNIGPFPCGGVVTVNSATKEITRSGQYWGLAHFSRSIKRGARRIGSEGTLAGISHVAFENQDGTKVAVVTNIGAARRATLRMASVKADVTLDADSLSTFAWS
ncbi:MAG TPA: glycoside hydrolase family 30 beta sandwich domain-containing protein [Verrucomicrobiae bacterium]|nr:glycoside hydrolase family 30 beta sandwich domain-containing protein [Verrucomicrobiae bacterium]